MTLSFSLHHIRYATCSPVDALMVMDHQLGEYHKLFALHATSSPIYYATIDGLINLTREFQYSGGVKYHDDIF